MKEGGSKRLCTAAVNSLKRSPRSVDASAMNVAYIRCPANRGWTPR